MGFTSLWASGKLHKPWGGTLAQNPISKARHAPGALKALKGSKIALRKPQKALPPPITIGPPPPPPPPKKKWAETPPFPSFSEVFVLRWRPTSGRLPIGSGKAEELRQQAVWSPASSSIWYPLLNAEGLGIAAFGWVFGGYLGGFRVFEFWQLGESCGVASKPESCYRQLETSTTKRQHPSNLPPPPPPASGMWGNVS